MTLRMRHIMVFIVLTHTAFGAARLTGTLYALSNKASAFTVGVQMALFALVPALLAVRAGRWLDTAGPFRPLLLGISLMTAGALLPALFPYEVADIAPLLVASALLGTGFMYVQITAQHVVGTLAAPDRRPAAFSMLALAFSTSGLIAPVGSGFLIDSIGHRATLGSIFVLLAVGVGLLLWQRARLPRPHAQRAESVATQSVRPVPRARGAARADHERPGVDGVGPADLPRPRVRHAHRPQRLADRRDHRRVRRGDVRDPAGDARAVAPLPRVAGARVHARHVRASRTD